MLADIGGDDRRIIHTGGHGTDQAVMAARIVLAGKAHGLRALELGHATHPGCARLCLHLIEQAGQRVFHVTTDGDIGRLDLVQFRRVDINVDDFGIRTEQRYPAGRPVVKTCTGDNQQIAFIQRQIGTSRTVHAEHPQIKRMFRRHGPQRHQTHHRRQRRLVGQCQGQR